MTTETSFPTEMNSAETKPKPRRTTRKSKASTGRTKRKKADHRPLKVMLTTGAFLATWMGTSWMAQQDAMAAAAVAQMSQPESVTVAYVASDGTVSERTLDLQPIPQVVATSKSSK